MIRITNAITLPDDQIEERFVRSIGPRRQNPHKYATAVELRLDIQRASLPNEMKQRLSDLAGRHMTKEGVLVVTAREHPSQLRNRQAARRTLIALLKRAATQKEGRLPTAAPAGVRSARFASKERKSALKQSRRKRRNDGVGD